MSIYDRADNLLRERHPVHVSMQMGWSCGCGKGTYSIMAAHVARRAASQHLKAESKRIMAELRAESAS